MIFALSKMCIRDSFTGEVNDNWHYVAMLENNQFFERKNESGDSDTDFQRAFLKGNIGVVNISVIVAILHAAEQPAPDTDLLKWHEAVRLVEHGCYGHAPAVALQLARQLDHEVDADLAHTLGDGARFGHHDHLVEFERHDALAVFERSRRQEIDSSFFSEVAEEK